MKKFFAILLSAMLMLSLAVPAMAEDTTTYSITINNSVAGYTYAAYQIFKGDLENENVADPNDTQTNNKLSNIEWGSSVSNGTTLGNAADYAERLATGYTGEDSLTLDSFIALITLGDPVKTVSDQTGSTYVIKDLKAGYYLIKNTAVPNGGAYTEYIIEVVENSTVTAKADVPEVTKKVDDKNDSNTSEDGETWQDSADYDIGDSVPFQLTATLADNVTAYKTYKVVFHDTLSSGLTYNNDAVVKLGDTVIYDAKDEANASEGVAVTHNDGILTITITDDNKPTVFEFTGLDDGDYRLTETVTPAGYNSIDPIEFTISAIHDSESTDPTLSNLTGTAKDNVLTFTDVLSAGSLSADVINNAGSTLPETGGMGTTIFYAVGGLMVVAAVVLLVTKKRMSAEG